MDEQLPELFSLASTASDDLVNSSHQLFTQNNKSQTGPLLLSKGDYSPPPPPPSQSPLRMNNSVKRRRRLLPEETEFLCKVFEQHPRPSAPLRDFLASKLSMSQRCIQIWFQNRRAKVKRDLIESGKAMLLFQASSNATGNSNSNLFYGYPSPPSNMFPFNITDDLQLGATPLSNSSSSLSFDELSNFDPLLTCGTFDDLEDLLSIPPANGDGL